MEAHITAEELVEQFEKRRRNFEYEASRFFRNPQDVEDILQTVIFKALRFRHTYNPEYKASTWLSRILRNEVFTERRRRNQLKNKGVHVEPNEGAEDTRFIEYRTPSDAAAASEQTEVIDEAIGDISADFKSRALWLRLRKQLSYDEIAELTDRPLGSVKSSIYRARRNLLRNPRFRDLFSEKLNQL